MEKKPASSTAPMLLHAITDALIESPANAIADVKVGDTVIVHDVNESQNGGPWTAQVVKVGPKNIFVKDRYGASMPYGPFDKQTSRIKDNYGHAYITTAEQDALGDRVHAAHERLRDVGFEAVGYKRADPRAIIELAAAAEVIMGKYKEAK